MQTDIKQASANREESLFNNILDKRIDLLLANYQRVTANPRSMGYLRFLMRHYAKSPTPWRDCFHPDTPVDCPRDHRKYPDGIPISNIKKDDLVWSFNEDLHVFELKRVIWSNIVRKNVQLSLLVLDNGKKIKCTPDHKFMCRDGTWKELQDLKTGDSLMPLYRDYLPAVRIDPNSLGWIPEHKIVADELFGKDKNKKHVHHADELRSNTDPNNFELLSSTEHVTKHHNTLRSTLEARGERWRCRGCGDLFVPEGRRQKYCGTCPPSFGYIKQVVGTEGKCFKCGNVFKKKSSTSKYCSKLCRDKSRDSINFCLECGIKLSGKGRSKYCKDHSPRYAAKQPMNDIRLCQNCGSEFVPKSGPQKHCSEKCRRSFSSAGLPTGNFNHKVDYIVLLDECSDVWDMEIEGNHNFVVQGVVAHNCVADNTKRFGPEKVKGLCGVLKDTIRQTTYWRGKKGHSKVPDVGDPGYAIGEADKGAAPPWGGHRHLSETNLDCGLMAMPDEVAELLEDLGEKCDVYRVLVGLDEPPSSDLVLL
jgi:Intein splicing domain